MNKKELLEALKYWPEEAQIKISIIANEEDLQDDGVFLRNITEIEFLDEESTDCYIYTW